jgi:hypothetical protein
MAGRKKLLVAMLTNAEKAHLGIDKFPPEKSMYAALLKVTGLHQCTEGKWGFGPPAFDQSLGSHISAAWRAIDVFFDSTDAAPRPIAGLFDQLRAAPYGLKAGVLPVLFLAAYLAYQGEIALYEGGYFVPFMSIELLERIFKEPRPYAIHRFRIDAIRQSLFRHYMKAVSGEGRLDNPNLIAVVKPLARFMMNLPDFSKKTKTVSPEAQAVRELFFAAKSPAQMLFVDLPKACGFQPMTDVDMDARSLEAYAKKFASVLVELRVAYHGLLRNVETMIKDAFGLDSRLALADVRDRLRGRYKGLEDYTIDLHGLRAFIGRLADPFGEEAPWLISLATFLARKPPEKWTDDDARAAEYRLVEFTKRLRDLEQLRLEYDTRKGHTSGSLEVMLLRVVRQGIGEFEAPVCLDETRQRAVQQSVTQIQAVLDQLATDDLRMAAVGMIASEILPARVETDTREKRAPPAGVTQ